MQRGNVEDLTLDGIGIVPQAGIGAEARPGRASELASNPLLFPGDMPYTLLHEAVMVFVMGLSRGIRLALCRRQDFQLGFSDALTFLVQVSQGIVAIWSTDEHQHTFGPLGDGDVTTGREGHVRQVGYGPFQPRIGADGVLPDLVGVGGQVHLPVRFAVQDAGPFVVEIQDGLVVGLILEEGFVGANHLRVLLQS